MNKIFKVIFNKSLGGMVIVSENAKSAGKTDYKIAGNSNSRSNTVHHNQQRNETFIFKPQVLKSLVLSITTIISTSVYADDHYAHTPNNTAIGSAKGDAHVTTDDGLTLKSVAGIAVTATGLGLNSITSFTVPGLAQPIIDSVKIAAFINAAQKGGNISIGAFGSAVGSGNIASGISSSALGYDNTASGISSSALGFVNTASSISSSAMGSGNLASGDYSSAVGSSNTASGTYSSAFGALSRATAEKSTAIGYESIADRANTISVGKLGSERQITNVAAGSQSTDAVNLGQVNSLINNITVGENYAHGDLSATAIGSASGQPFITKNNGTVLTEVAGVRVTATGLNIDNVSSFFITDGSNNQVEITDPDKVLAFKHAAKNGANIAVGKYSVALGSHNIASGNSSSALGYLNTVSGNSSSALGYLNKALGNSSSAVGFLNTASSISSSAVGYNNIASGNYSSAVGSGNSASGNSSSAVGYGNLASGTYSSAFGALSQATAEKSTAIGFESIADRANTISVGKSGAEKQITNVAAGSQSTDAVNKLQMDDSVGVVNSRVTSEVGILNGKITANSNAITGLDSRVTTNEGDIANLQ